MKYALYLFALLGFYSCSFAQNDSLKLINSAKKDVNVLCSRYMAGRGYTHEGHHKAASYLEERYKKIGLASPLSLKDSLQWPTPYQQTFPLNILRFDDAALSLNGKKIPFGEEVILHDESGIGKGSASIIDIGFGIPELAPWPDLEGKMVMVSDGLPQEMDSVLKEKYKSKARVETRLAEIEAQKPAGIIVKRKKLTASFGEIAKPYVWFDILGDSLPDQVFTTAKWSVKGEADTLVSQNVLGYVKGTTYPDSFIVVSAHYDHLGQIGKAIFTGANDNASGVSMLLSMAEHFQQNPAPYSILFICFGGEEVGLIGSSYYVNQQPIIPMNRTKFVLNLDLMGNGADGCMAVGGSDFPEYYNKLVALNEKKKAVTIIKQRKNAPNSDHYFFLKNGVKGFFIYTMGGPQHYHDVFDSPKHLQLSHFVNIRNLLIEFLAGM